MKRIKADLSLILKQTEFLILTLNIWASKNFESSLIVLLQFSNACYKQK